MKGTKLLVTNSLVSQVKILNDGPGILLPGAGFLG